MAESWVYKKKLQIPKFRPIKIQRAHYSGMGCLNTTWGGGGEDTSWWGPKFRFFWEKLNLVQNWECNIQRLERSQGVLIKNFNQQK